jgi:hypothetical protein
MYRHFGIWVHKQLKQQWIYNIFKCWIFRRYERNWRNISEDFSLRISTTRMSTYVFHNVFRWVQADTCIDFPQDMYHHFDIWVHKQLKQQWIYNIFKCWIFRRSERNWRNMSEDFSFATSTNQDEYIRVSQRLPVHPERHWHWFPARHVPPFWHLGSQTAKTTVNL